MHTDMCGNIFGQSVTQREAGYKLMYRILCTEIRRMWDVKCMIIPVITGSTGIVTKVL